MTGSDFGVVVVVFTMAILLFASYLKERADDSTAADGSPDRADSPRAHVVPIRPLAEASTDVGGQPVESAEVSGTVSWSIPSPSRTVTWLFFRGRDAAGNPIIIRDPEFIGRDQVQAKDRLKAHPQDVA
jgi:hypothetical protein